MVWHLPYCALRSELEHSLKLHLPTVTYFLDREQSSDSFYLH